MIFGKQIGFTGSQANPEQRQLVRLRFVFDQMIADGAIWLHNGDCVGSDLAAAILWRAGGGLVFGHPPIVSTKRAWFDFDDQVAPRDYLERNQDIVDQSDILVATPDKAEVTRSGTWSTIRHARKRGIRRVIIYRDGTIHEES